MTPAADPPPPPPRDLPTDAPPAPDAPDAPARADRSAIAKLLTRPLTDDDMREHTASVATPISEQSRDVRGVMIVRIGVERLALPADAVSRVTPDRPAHRIPHRSNAIVRGVCNIDGDLVLTAALDELLQIPVDPNAAAERRMVVIGDDGARWAFTVDAVLGVEPIEVQAFRDLPVTVEHALVHFARALITTEAGQATLLDPAALVRGFDGALR